MIRTILATLLVAFAAPAVAQLEELTQREALAGVRAALERGARSAVAALGQTDGFLGNPQVKIPLPESLARTAFGLIKSEHADLDRYVTLKALDGLYFMLGE